MAIDLTKFVLRFIEEARDHLRRLNEGLSLIEQGNESAEQLNALFRSAHTIKGSARMLKLMPVSDLAHQVEDVLAAMRDGQLSWNASVIGLLYQGVDALAALVDQLAIHKDPQQLTFSHAPLVESLKRLLTAESPSAEDTTSNQQPLPEQSDSNSVAPKPESSTGLQASIDVAPSVTLKTAETVRIRLNKLDELLSLMSEMVSSHSRLRQRLVDVHQLGISQPVQGASQSLRSFQQALKDDVQYQEQQMTELLDKALQMRMLPLAMVFEPATRLVRELGQSLGKRMTSVIQGAEIELDRQLIDRLSDPIVHLIRNAIDHGIESPEQRVALGKPGVGKISLSAKQDGGWVVIEVADDGAGIALSSVLDKAIRKGLISESQAEGLSQAEIIDFIFMPGFSTSPLITDLSGRGVGMDVVRSIIVDDLHGSIDVKTQLNRGSVFQLRLPLSLAVMRVLMVKAAQQIWGFAAQYVVELLRIPSSSLMDIAERRVMILRNEFVPVMELAALLGLPSADQPSSLLLLVVQLNHEKLALVVDSLIDERDLVIKPLPEHLAFNQRVAGMVVTGNNQLVNVLHAPALFALAQASRKPQPITEAHNQPQQASAKHLLVVDDSLNTREIEKDVLEAYGYQVTLAEDGVDALNKAKLTEFDAVLTDVEMPNMDGFTLTAQLRQDERYRHKPIMIITSREKEADKRRGMQVGADAYIVKGDFDQSNLINTLQALLA